MYRKGFPTVRETVEQLRVLLDAERNPRLRPRLQLLLLIRSGQVQSREEAAARAPASAGYAARND